MDNSTEASDQSMNSPTCDPQRADERSTWEQITTGSFTSDSDAPLGDTGFFLLTDDQIDQIMGTSILDLIKDYPSSDLPLIDPSSDPPLDNPKSVQPIAMIPNNISEEATCYMNNMFKHEVDELESDCNSSADASELTVAHTSDPIPSSSIATLPPSQCYDGNSSGYSTLGSSPDSDLLLEPVRPSFLATHMFRHFNQIGSSCYLTSGGSGVSNVKSTYPNPNPAMVESSSENSSASSSPDPNWVSYHEPSQMTANNNHLYKSQPYVPNYSTRSGDMVSSMGSSYQIPNQAMGGMGSSYQISNQAMVGMGSSYQIPNQAIGGMGSSYQIPNQAMGGMGSSYQIPNQAIVGMNYLYPSVPLVGTMPSQTQGIQHPAQPSGQKQVQLGKRQHQDSESPGPSTAKRRKNTSPTKDGRKECYLCHKTFTDNHALKVHYRTHTGERPYPCLICGKAYKQFAHLKKHEQSKSHIAIANGSKNGGNVKKKKK